MSIPPPSILGTLPRDVVVSGADRDQAARLRALVADLAPPVQSVQPSSLDRPRIPPASTWKHPGRTAKVVTVASGKGGVGKTSVAVNLSIAFHRAGLRTTLVDADLGTANADVVCGISPARRLDQAICDSRHALPLSKLSIPTPYGFHLIPGAVGMAAMTDLSSDHRRRLVNGLIDLDRTSDIIVIDTAAGIGPNTRCFMHAADLPLVVVTPDPASIADAYALLKCLATEGLSHNAGLSLVINQVSSVEEAAHVHERLAAVTRRFLKLDPPSLGSIMWDSHVLLASRARRPLLADPCKFLAAKGLSDLALASLVRMGLSSPDTLVKPAIRSWWTLRRQPLPRA